MIRRHSILTIMLALTGWAAMTGARSEAGLPDPLAAGWNGNKVCEQLHKDNKNRILRCTFAPAVGHERHYHDRNFGHVLAGGRMRITDAEGTREVDLVAGSSFASDGLDWHEVMNVGDTTVVYLMVEPKDTNDLIEFATAYAAAWSGQDPDAFAAHYAEDGTFRISDGEVSDGREAISKTA